MRIASNGLCWTNDFWSQKHAFSTDIERHNVNQRLYEVLFSDDQCKLVSDNWFEDEILLFSKKLIGSNLFEMLLYSEKKKFEIKPIELHKLIQGVLIQEEKSSEAFWFAGYEGSRGHHDISTFGLYSFKGNSSSKSNGNLYPILNYILSEDHGQGIEYNSKVFSGIIGGLWDWLLLFVLDKEAEKGLSIKVAGDKTFCLSIKKNLNL